jgi:hypothetical protein
MRKEFRARQNSFIFKKSDNNSVFRGSESPNSKHHHALSRLNPLIGANENGIIQSHRQNAVVLNNKDDQ